MSLENQESQKEENRLEQLQEAIKHAPQSIEEEFARTANPWLSCFGSSVFVVETYLNSPRLRAMVPQEKYAEAETRMEELKQRLYELKEIYPEKKDLPPIEIRQELLDKLDIFR